MHETANFLSFYLTKRGRGIRNLGRLPLERAAQQNAFPHCAAKVQARSDDGAGISCSEQITQWCSTRRDCLRPSSTFPETQLVLSLDGVADRVVVRSIGSCATQSNVPRVWVIARDPCLSVCEALVGHDQVNGAPTVASYLNGNFSDEGVGMAPHLPAPRHQIAVGLGPSSLDSQQVHVLRNEGNQMHAASCLSAISVSFSY